MGTVQGSEMPRNRNRVLARVPLSLALRTVRVSLGVVRDVGGFLLGIGCGVVVGSIVVGRRRSVKHGGLARRVEVVRASREDDPSVLDAMRQELPGWVRSPMDERAVWVNAVAAKAWPVLAVATEGVIQWGFDCLTGLMRSQRLPVEVALEAVHLGSLPPMLDSIRSQDTRDDEVLLEPCVKWASDGFLRFLITVGRFKLRIEVSAIQIMARMRVVFKPLMAHAPFFAALSLQLVEPASWDVMACIGGMDVMTVSRVNSIVHELVESILWAVHLSWPRRIVIRLPFLERYSRQHRDGTLQVHIIRGEGVGRLNTADTFTQSYVRLYVREEAQVEETESLFGRSSPEWDASYGLSVYDINCDHLHIEVFNYRFLLDNLLLGWATLPIASFSDGSCHEMSVPLRQPPDFEEANARKDKDGIGFGSVHVKLTYHPFKGRSSGTRPKLFFRRSLALRDRDGNGWRRPGVLVIQVWRGINLVPRHDASSNPCVKVRFQGEVYRTQTISKDLNPRWNHEFEIVLDRPPVGSDVSFEVWTRESSWAPRESLGAVTLHLDYEATSRGLSRFFDLEGVPHGQLKVGIVWNELDEKEEAPGAGGLGAQDGTSKDTSKDGTWKDGTGKKQGGAAGALPETQDCTIQSPKSASSLFEEQRSWDEDMDGGPGSSRSTTTDDSESGLLGVLEKVRAFFDQGRSKNEEDWGRVEVTVQTKKGRRRRRRRSRRTGLRDLFRRESVPSEAGSADGTSKSHSGETTPDASDSEGRVLEEAGSSKGTGSRGTGSLADPLQTRVSPAGDARAAAVFAADSQTEHARATLMAVRATKTGEGEEGSRVVLGAEIQDRVENAGELRMAQKGLQARVVVAQCAKGGLEGVVSSNKSDVDRDLTSSEGHPSAHPCPSGDAGGLLGPHSTGRAVDGEALGSGEGAHECGLPHWCAMSTEWRPTEDVRTGGSRQREAPDVRQGFAHVQTTSTRDSCSGDDGPSDNIAAGARGKSGSASTPRKDAIDQRTSREGDASPSSSSSSSSSDENDASHKLMQLLGRVRKAIRSSDDEA